MRLLGSNALPMEDQEYSVFRLSRNIRSPAFRGAISDTLCGNTTVQTYITEHLNISDTTKYY